MYCPYCQTVLTDDAVFCRHCGKRVRETSADTSIKNKDLDTLNSMLRHFSQKQSTYDLYDEVCSKINRLSRGASNALLIWGGILSGLALLIILSLISSGGDFQDISGGLFASIFLVLVPGIMMIAGGIMKKVYHRNTLVQHQLQYVALSKELLEHFQCYPNCPVAPEYTNPRVLVKLQDLLFSGKAGSLKESMNHLYATSSYKSIARYQEVTQRNTDDYNYRNGIHVIFLPPGYFH